MSQQIADIALMYVLPLGIAFVAILQSVSAETRNQKFLGVILSVLIVAMDCVFYFARNSFIVYNCDGGLLLSFASLFVLGFIYAVKSDDRPAKVGHFIFSGLMFVSFLGIAYWDRPTFIPTQEYSPSEIEAYNEKYQDYINSFQNGSNPTATDTEEAQVTDSTAEPKVKPGSNEAALSRLESYTKEASAVIDRMKAIAESIRNFEKDTDSLDEAQRENLGRQALAISNNAVALNKKILGLFHPHEASEAHTELIQASENARLAAYSLYNFAIQENPEEQQNQYNQATSQVEQMKASIERFLADIENLKTNYQPQTTEQQDQQ